MGHIVGGRNGMFNFDMRASMRRRCRTWLTRCAERRVHGDCAVCRISDQGLARAPSRWVGHRGTRFSCGGLYSTLWDKRLLEENYEPTKRWIALLRLRARRHPGQRHQRHESLVPSARFDGTGFYYFNVKLFFQHSAALERSGVG